MKKILLLIATCAAAALVPVSAALAQSPEDAVVGEDGRITIGGDTGTDCGSFAQAVREGYTQGLTAQQVRDVLARCEQYGVSSPAASSSPSASPEPQPQGPPDYAVQEDGTVVIGGDVGTDCRSFAVSVEGGYSLGLTDEQRRQALAECERLGFLPATGTSTVSASASAPPERPGGAGTTPATPGPSSGGPAVLPETGGPALPLLPVAILLVGAGVLIAASGQRRG